MTGFHVRGSQSDPAPERPNVSAGDEVVFPALPASADRADCCCAAAAVRVQLPQPDGRPAGTDLLFCLHHYRQHRAALVTADAEVFDANGVSLIQRSHRGLNPVLVALDD
jgi:hypothetical protein